MVIIMKDMTIKDKVTHPSCWAGKTGDMTFSTVECHADGKYTNENPYKSYVVVNKGFDGAGKYFKIEFYATSCEYDNFKSVVVKTDDKEYEIEFNENGWIYFNNQETFVSYDIDKWYKFEILFCGGVIFRINDIPVIKLDEKVTKIKEIGIKTVGFPTYGPILGSSIGICDIDYEFENIDFDAVEITENEYFYTADKHSIDAVAEAVNLSNLAVMDNGSERIRHSLNFSASSFSDISVVFSSDDEAVITKSGRVIRPKEGEPDKRVKVTAKISDGNREIFKEFDFVVLAQERCSDPGYMSDEEFFGKYNGDAIEVKGKLDYKKLPIVEKYVKQGNYRLAKEELAKHFKNKAYQKREINHSEFDAGYAEMILNDFHQLQQGYFMGAFNSSDGAVKINHSLIKPNSTMTFSVRAMHNESSAFVIGKKPVLVLETDRRTINCEVSETAMVQSGKYRNTHVGDDVQKAEMYGEFLGNRTSYILMKFRIYGFEQNEKIIAAKLKMQGTVTPEYVGDKRLIVIKEFSSTWNAWDVKFSDLIYGVYSYQGLADKNKWGRPPYADVEYLWQTSRFPFYASILNEYEKTKDAEILYKLKKNIEEAILTFGNFKSSLARYTYNENGIRGGYTRTLDASAKYSQWILLFIYLSQSNDVEFIIAFVKAIWDSLNYLLSNCDRDMGNWTEFIFRGILMSSDVIDEFNREFNGEDWLEVCLDTYEKTICGCFFPDGSYKEGNSGYCQTALDNYIKVREKFELLGVEVSDNYKAMIKKNAHYCANLFTADGSSLVYGDCINYRREEYNDWEKICSITNDEELEYLVTYGEKGKKPNSTMYHSKDSRLTVMRSGFDKEAVYLFTDVRGGGGHSHCDENSIIMAAYSKTLLCDSGVFSYTTEDPYRIWGISTRAHNTVEIDENNQKKSDFVNEVPQGKIHEIYDDEKLSRVVQSSYAYEACEHKRSIIFIKPDIFIVKDELIPNDDKCHTYDVLWHFLPNSNVVCSDNICKTNFENSANLNMIIIGDVQNEILNGYVDLSYGQIEESQYLRSRIASGRNESVITVLIPQKKGEMRNVTAYCENSELVIRENEKIIFRKVV